MILDLLFAISMVFTLVGALGLLRMPDVYNRLHASTMVCVGGTMLGAFVLAIRVFPMAWVASTKLLLLIFVLVCTAPTGSHMIANAAYAVGIKPVGVKHDAPV